VYHVASWILVGLFTFMAAAHLVLTVLFYTGVHDTGVGYMLNWEWPAWLVTIIDATVAWLLWFSYRHCTDRTTLGLILTVAASVLALARAAWMVFVPILLILVIAMAVIRLVEAGQLPPGHDGDALGTVGPVIAFTGSLEVQGPPDLVFEKLADMDELHRWNPNVRSCRRVSGERFVPGSRYQSVIVRGP